MNTDVIYSSLGADPDLGELVEMFVQEMPDRVSALETQAQSRDWAQLTRTAHQLLCRSAESAGFCSVRMADYLERRRGFFLPSSRFSDRVQSRSAGRAREAGSAGRNERSGGAEAAPRGLGGA
jgi:hypothetical protein